MADSPLKAVQDVVTYSITSAGSPIPDTYLVFDISVTKALNKIPTAVIRVQDGEMASQETPATDSATFVPGTEIEIQAGYNSTNATIFKGIVVSMRLVLDAEDGTVLEVVCKDKAVQMTVGRKNAYYSEMTDSDIISQIIGNYSGLTPTVDSTTAQNAELVQYYCTDWDFMMTRADLNGMVAVVDQNAVTIQKPATSGSAVLTLTYGIDIIEFNAELNSMSQVAASSASSWDYSTQALVQSTGSAPTVNSQGNITSSTLSSVMNVTSYALQSFGSVVQDDLQVWADTQLLKAALSRITGSVKFAGSSLVNPGNTVELAGVSARFNGTAYVSGVSHRLKDGEWLTEVTFGLEDEWFSEKTAAPNPGASGLVPGVAGLMNGVVKQLDQDPNGEYRIQLTLPLMQSDSDGIWARLSTFYATNGKGIFFVPEIGDEVIVGFLNNDPRFPIVLGSLYSSSRTAPNDLTADNYTKAIITNSECKIAFDDENKIITITTPGNNQMVYSDKDKGITITDQNNNSITMGSDGITIQDKNNNKIAMTSGGIELNTGSNIKLVATGNVQITPTGNAEITATQDVKASGINVSLNANASFKAAGMASGEVSSTGTMTVKGTMVMIN